MTTSIPLEERLKRINLATLLATAAGEEELFNLIVTTAAQIAQAEHSLLFVYDSKNEVLRLRACYPSQQLHAFEIEPGKGIVGNVFLSGQPLIVADLAANTDLGASVGSLLHDSELAGSIPIDDVIAVPVTTGDQALGVLEIVNKHGEGAFAQRDSDMVSAFAKIVAISLQDNQTDRDISRILAEALHASDGLTPDDQAAISAIDEDPALREALDAADLLRGIQEFGSDHLAFCRQFLASYLAHIKKGRRPSA